MTIIQKPLSLIRIAFMVSITIHNVESELKQKLQDRAVERGHSMEEEAHRILRSALESKLAPPKNLAIAIWTRFSSLGGIDLELPPREPNREPPRFD